MSSTVEKEIIVNLPISTVYNQWTQFEEFPEFMEGVEDVVQLSDTKLHWVAEIGGVVKEWDAEIVEQVPDQRISWRSTSGAINNGVISFNSVEQGTRVVATMSYDPEGFIESVGDVLGFVSRRVENDLERFRNFIESRQAETGAWRGEVRSGTTRGMGHNEDVLSA
jgi:uncharacterized membrane protein